MVFANEICEIIASNVYQVGSIYNKNQIRKGTTNHLKLEPPGNKFNTYTFEIYCGMELLELVYV